MNRVRARTVRRDAPLILVVVTREREGRREGDRTEQVSQDSLRVSRNHSVVQVDALAEGLISSSWPGVLRPSVRLGARVTLRFRGEWSLYSEKHDENERKEGRRVEQGDIDHPSPSNPLQKSSCETAV